MIVSVQIGTVYQMPKSPRCYVTNRRYGSTRRPVMCLGKASSARRVKGSHMMGHTNDLTNGQTEPNEARRSAPAWLPWHPCAHTDRLVCALAHVNAQHCQQCPPSERVMHTADERSHSGIGTHTHERLISAINFTVPSTEISACSREQARRAICSARLKRNQSI